MELGHSGPRLPEALPPLPSPCNAPWGRCQLELELESQPSSQPELGSAEMLFGMLTTDSSWVRRGDSEEGPTAGGLFAHADQVLAPYGSHDTPPGSSSDPVTLEFRPHYAKGLYLSGASAPHCTAQPVSSWSGSRLMHWLSFQVRCESCVVSTAVLVTAVPAVLASLAQADSSWDFDDPSRRAWFRQGFPAAVREAFASCKMDGAAFLLLTSSVLRSAMQLEPESAQQICDALSVVRSKLDAGPELGTIW